MPITLKIYDLPIIMYGDERPTIRAFPSAIGLGCFASGGRFGDVYHVTNLNESGPGSLEYGLLNASGPRNIVFDISGDINIVSNNKILSVPSNITIAGETAPSPGICIKNGIVRTDGNNIIIKHIRIRQTDSAPYIDKSKLDNLVINGSNQIIDHCSFSWSVAHLINFTAKPKSDITISNCLIYEALSNSIHPSGEHSRAISIESFNFGVSIAYNIIAHCYTYVPNIKGLARVGFTNNLVYNTKFNFSEIHLLYGDHFVDFIGNDFQNGPSKAGNENRPVKIIGASDNCRIHLSDNMWADFYFGIDQKKAVENISGIPTNNIASNSKQCDNSYIIISPAYQMHGYLRTNCGCMPVYRDEIDERLVETVKNYGGSIIDSQNDVGGYIPLATNTRVFVEPQNQNVDSGDGYSNLEKEFHKLSSEVENPNITPASAKVSVYNDVAAFMTITNRGLRVAMPYYVSIKEVSGKRAFEDIDFFTKMVMVYDY